MPNWCENCLIVKGQKEKVQEFVDKAKGVIPYEDDELDELKGEPLESLLVFSNFYPIPKEVLSQDDAWYDWALENWGCKWDPDQVELDVVTLGENAVATYHFLTPWSPPDAFVRKISQDMPELDFSLTYAEPGVGFYGKLEIIKGKLVADNHYEM